jgi:hypothetical protein
MLKQASVLFYAFFNLTKGYLLVIQLQVSSFQSKPWCHKLVCFSMAFTTSTLVKYCRNKAGVNLRGSTLKLRSLL